MNQILALLLQYISPFQPGLFPIMNISLAEETSKHESLLDLQSTRSLGLVKSSNTRNILAAHGDTD